MKIKRNIGMKWVKFPTGLIFLAYQKTSHTKEDCPIY